MIARFATSPPVDDPEIEAQRRDNLQRRLKPGLLESDGFRVGIWLKRNDGTVHSITLWDSEEAMRAAEQAVNARPLLSGQQVEALPGPTSGQVVEVVEVLDLAVAEQANG